MLTLPTTVYCVGLIILWAWGSVVVKELRYKSKGPGSIPGRVTGDFFSKHPPSPCASKNEYQESGSLKLLDHSRPVMGTLLTIM